MPRGSTDKNVGCNHCTDQTIHSAQWFKATRYRLPYRLFAWLVRVGNELPTLPGCARGPKIADAMEGIRVRCAQPTPALIPSPAEIAH